MEQDQVWTNKIVYSIFILGWHNQRNVQVFLKQFCFIVCIRTDWTTEIYKDKIIWTKTKKYYHHLECVYRYSENKASDEKRQMENNAAENGFKSLRSLLYKLHSTKIYFEKIILINRTARQNIVKSNGSDTHNIDRQ